MDDKEKKEKEGEEDKDDDDEEEVKRILRSSLTKTWCTCNKIRNAIPPSTIPLETRTTERI